MDTNFKPMLATDADLSKLRFPVWASVKLDGIRAVVRDGVVYSRRLKPIPSTHVQRLFGHCEYADGELIVGDITSPSCYRDTMSGCMSRDGAPNVTFWAFDHIEHPTRPYYERHTNLSGMGGISVLQHALIENIHQLLHYEQVVLSMGHEGLILRSALAPYKFGRSTVREGYLLKLKRFVDNEFTVVGFEERMHNGNEAKENALGYMKRSSHQANKTGRGDLGSLVLEGHGFQFTVGSGFDDALRAEIWNNREKYLGKIAKVKYFAVGMKDAPRHPVFLGWRSLIDL